MPGCSPRILVAESLFPCIFFIEEKTTAVLLGLSNADIVDGVWGDIGNSGGVASFTLWRRGSKRYMGEIRDARCRTTPRSVRLDQGPDSA